MNELTNIIGGAVTSAAIYFLYMSYKESRARDALRKEKLAYGAVISPDRAPNYMQSKTFTVREALNGQYIEFHKHKYNPNGPDTNEQCVYIVKDNETLIDAISVVLVLMNKED